MRRCWPNLDMPVLHMHVTLHLGEGLGVFSGMLDETTAAEEEARERDGVGSTAAQDKLPTRQALEWYTVDSMPLCNRVLSFLGPTSLMAHSLKVLERRRRSDCVARSQLTAS